MKTITYEGPTDTYLFPDENVEFVKGTPLEVADDVAKKALAAEDGDFKTSKAKKTSGTSKKSGGKTGAANSQDASGSAGDGENV